MTLLLARMISRDGAVLGVALIRKQPLRG